ncbi:hypothetical protein HAZT_HAZT002347 [Hyalella azteca]|uniref:Ig-like domain-containing protein n=1 Tax=Hyalella azteca TaxID=294128 RepID=A0A6A0H4V3_HYAAZ|nr:hypothetical protein HAZT_HAZT002347 [Hyalella azteca]
MIMGLINLQRIYVSRCKLVQLDDAAFRGLSNLVELDLSHNELNMVPAAALEHTAALMRLLLSHNPITQIRDGAFSKLQSLMSLEMTGCALQVLESRAFQGLDKLEWLKLDDNLLTSVPETMLLPKMLHGVDLHNNPWNCDCKLQHLRSWLVKYNVPSSIEPKCSTPPRLESQIIKHVFPEDFACPPEIRPTSLFLDVQEGKNVSFACHVVAEPSADIDWRKSRNHLHNNLDASTSTKTEKVKVQTGAAISAMPKYIQMGTPTPKSNGIANIGAPISVIGASPYRSTPPGAPHPNPDIISDSSVEERTKPKKKVSIMGVEEVDPNGVITTRRLNDIVEEYEENFSASYDQNIPNLNEYDPSQEGMNPYSNISKVPKPLQYLAVTYSTTPSVALKNTPCT